MHIVLVSLCEKKAWKRSRAILDSYALRAGERTWMTPITEEGLHELRSALRRQATRQTSVACFRNAGRSKMTLLWVVGNRDGFGKDGITPVAFQKKKEKKQFPPWGYIASYLAESAGLMHDLGKFGKAFQEKLSKPEPTADPVRHEWLSLILVRKLLAEPELPKDPESWTILWKNIWESIGKTPEIDRYKALVPFDGPLRKPENVLLFLIATHHRLPACPTGIFNNENHVRKEDGNSHVPEIFDIPELNTFLEIGKCLTNLRALNLEHSPPEDPLYWKVLAWISRVALILADHSVSALEPGDNDMPIPQKPVVAYANTKKRGKERLFNQELNWHLRNVGQKAPEMLHRIFSLTPPSLSEEAIEKIQSTSKDRYSWQNGAERAISRSKRSSPFPHLIFNMAGTGSGKTRMNAKAICALNEDSGQVRFATALNLRSLTLQTGVAYHNQLGIGSDEMSCVIGSSITKKLFEIAQNKTQLDRKDFSNEDSIIDDDENLSEEEFDSESDFEWSDRPEWLKGFLERKPKMHSVIGSPVLVSTIDFLIEAGDPRKQGNHALAMLRIMTSDLILDEIDSYDPRPLISVMRLVWLAGLFGRNLVVSSATLSRPVARMIWSAFASGIRADGLMDREKPSFVSVLIDDLTTPTTILCEDESEFMQKYETHLSGMWNKIGKNINKKAFLLPVSKVNENEASENGGHGSACTVSIKEAILSGIKTLHEANHIVDPKTGKKVSFGLVRMANISPAIEVAGDIAGKMSGSTKVVCYHSQHTLIQRTHIEARLDDILCRQKGDTHIFEDPEIRQAIDGCKKNNLAFIVVATPVEEIGRDHDFDWAIIEPSSVQSIVQAAGRVNRHRCITVSAPNIGILQLNVKAAKNKEVVFCRPGLENGESPYKSHDLEELLDWDWLKDNPLDARLRFDSIFQKWDDESIEKQARLDSGIGIGTERMEDWMGADYYERTKLRPNDAVSQEFFLPDPENSPDKIKLSLPAGYQDRTIEVISEKHRENAWLVLSGSEMLGMLEKYGIEREKGLKVKVTSYPRKNEITRDKDFGFSVRRQNRRV